MEIPSINPEQIANKPEIIHSGDYDIVLGLEAQIDVRELESFLDGVDNKQVIDENDLDSEEERKFVFESGGKKYFVKQKWYDVRQQESIYGRRNSKSDSSFGSILNEFSLTPEVDKVLNDPTLKEKVTAMGFDKVKLIPVLAGVVRRSTGQKFLIYEFVELDEFQDNDLEELLVEGLQTAGIEPNDLGFLLRCDANNKRLIYLLDIEGYKRV